MNVVLIVIVFFAVLLVQKMKRLDPVSNVTLLLFNLYWFFSLMLSTTGLNNFFIPRDTTLVILLGGVCMFNLGYYALTINKDKVQTLDIIQLNRSFDAFLSNRLIKLVVVISSVYVIYILTQYYQILVYEQISGGEMRKSMSDQTFDLDVPFASLFSYIFPLLIPLARIMFCYSILYRRNIYTIVLFVLLFGYSSLSFGRMMYLIALLPIVLIIGVFQSSNNKIVISVKQRLFFLAMLSALIIIMSFVSSLRLGALGDLSMQDGLEIIATQVTDYSSGAIVGFDAALQNDYVDKTGGFKYGMVTLWPFLFPFTALSHLIGEAQYATGEWAYLSDFIERYFPIVRTDGGTWNGLFTWNILFYNDFGNLGILLFNFLFGLLMRFCIKRIYEKQSFLSVVIGSIFFIMVVLSPTKLWGYETFSGVALFLFISMDLILGKRMRVLNPRNVV